MPLEQRVELDVEEALRSVDSIEAALTGAAQSFKVAIAEALDLLSDVTVGEVDAGAVTVGIDQAVEAANLEPAIAADAAGVTTAIDEAVGAADTDVAVDADTAGVTDAVSAAVADADSDVVVRAITDDVTDQIEAAVAEADSEVVVTGDTTDLQQSLGEAGTAGEAGAEGLGEFSSVTEQISSTSGVATGDVANLAGTLGSITPKGSAATAGIIGVVAGMTGLVDAALSSEAATDRFTASLGEAAEEVNRVNVVGFADDLGSLARQTGNSASGMRLAAAGIADLGNSAGASQTQIAGAATDILLLATRLSVVNPRLGQAGDIAENLTRALARGGRALVPYGINLDTAAIKARAVADAGGDATAETDRFALAAAGAALVSEQLGSKLQTDIVEGSKKTEIQLRSLQRELGAMASEAGKPLLEPFLESVRESLPILISLGSTFGELAATVLPLVATTLHALEPAIGAVTGGAQGLLTVLQPVVALIDAIPDPILQTVAAALVFSRVLSLVNIGVGNLLTRLGQGGAGFAGLLSPMTAVALGVGVLISVIQAHNAARAAERQAIKEVSDAFLDEAESIDQDISARVRQRLESKNQLDDLTRLGVSVRQFGELASDGARGFETFLDTAVRTGEVGATVRAALLEQGLSVREIKSQYEAAGVSAKDFESTNFDLIDTFRKLSAETQKGADAALTKLVVDEKLTQAARDQAVAANTAKDGTVDYVGALRDVAPTSEEAGQAAQDFGTQLSDAAEEAKALEDAIGKLVDAQIGYLDSNLAAQNSALRFSDSLVDVKAKTDAHAEALRQHRVGSVEASEAQRELDDAIRAARDAALNAAEAQLRLAEDQAKANGTTLTAEERQRTFRAALQTVADQAGPNGPVRDAINGLIATYDALPPAKETVITANTTGAVRAVDSLQAKLNALDRGVIGVTIGGAAMAGGTFEGGSSGQFIETGERGRELAFVAPNTTMTVIPNNRTEDLLAQLAGRGSGSTINVYEVAGDPQATAFAVDARLGGRRR